MMLGKNAGGLFWMFRYIERAENIARLLEAGWHIALTRTGGGVSEWQSILTTAGINAAYREKHDEYEPAAVINFLLRDKTNPSSVMNAIEAARTNGRMVRTALSGEVWEAVNECWMTMKDSLARPVTERSLHDTLSTIRHGTSVVRGALHGTMLRNDIYAFSRLGTFIERADNTARILDVKYYVLLPSATFVGSTIDNAQWEVILRSVSAARSYQWLNGGNVSPKGIAEFLILDKRMPRSLAFCYSKIGQYLEQLEQEYGARQDSQIHASQICERLKSATVQDIFEDGLHEFLTEVISDTSSLAQHIETDFRFYR